MKRQDLLYPVSYLKKMLVLRAPLDIKVLILMLERVDPETSEINLADLREKFCEELDFYPSQLSKSLKSLIENNFITRITKDVFKVTFDDNVQNTLLNNPSQSANEE